MVTKKENKPEKKKAKQGGENKAKQTENNKEKEMYGLPPINSASDILYEIQEIITRNERLSHGLATTYDHLSILYLFQKIAKKLLLTPEKSE